MSRPSPLSPLPSGSGPGPRSYGLGVRPGGRRLAARGLVAALALAVLGAADAGARIGPDPSRTSYRINAGGEPWTDASGVLWESDRAYALGGTPALDASVPVVGSPRAGLFHTTRYDDDPARVMTYHVPVAAGRYRVRIHSVETWPAMREGQRRFGITLEGRRVVEGLDLVAATGSVGAVHTEDHAVDVRDGALTIGFVADVLHPLVAAIEIDRVEGIEPIATGPAPETARRDRPGPGVAEDPAEQRDAEVQHGETVEPSDGGVEIGAPGRPMVVR